MHSAPVDAYTKRHSEETRVLASLSGGRTVRLATDGPGVALYPDYTDAILRRDARCVLGAGVVFIPRTVFLCSAYNRKNAWAGLKLRQVCGSLGFGTQRAPWFEHGNPAYCTAAEFMAGHAVDWDWHVWLQSGERIWDVYAGSWGDLAAAHGQSVDFGATDEVIDGVETSALRARGLHYCAAPPDIQCTLLHAATAIFSPLLSALHL